MDSKPALLRNRPVFEHKVPIVRPMLPDFKEIEDGIQGILDSGMLTAGRYLRQFEQAIADHLGVQHAVAVSSCTMGLMLTYRGLGLTGDVIVPSFTFMATVSALIWSGLRPIFADVNLNTTNLDPTAVEAAITPQTSAIVGTHNFGNPADIDALQAIARRHHLKLIFDAAHGFGSLCQGVPVGKQADAQVYSLSPTKLLIAGEGGIVATSDSTLADTIRIGREYGNRGNYDSAFAGANGRMSEFHALLGLHSLNLLETAATRRNKVVGLYQQQLGCLPGIGFQYIRPGDRSSYKDFSITIEPEAFGLDRNQLAQALAAENIDTRSYYNPPVHGQTAYRIYAPVPEMLRCTNMLSDRSLSLPIWSHMDDTTALGICYAIQRNHQYAGDVKNALRQPQAVTAVA